MRHSISKWWGRARLLFSRRPSSALPEPPEIAPVAPEEPPPTVVVGELSGWYRTPATPHGASCGIYLWATAHGIDIKASSPLRRCDCVTGASEGLPEAGAVVVDTRTGRVGEVIAYEGERRVVLRPPAGGGEWEADADVVRDATDAELLSAKVRFANAMSRWGQWAHLHDHG